jgi:hypothetical protein
MQQVLSPAAAARTRAVLPAEVSSLIIPPIAPSSAFASAPRHQPAELHHVTRGCSWVLRLIGFRVLHPRNSNQRKVILRLVYRDGYKRYEWIDTRCGIRYA